MAWKYREISTFPALYSDTMRQAVANLGESVPFFSYGTKRQAEGAMNKFRHYRWCLRQRRGSNTNLEQMEDLYQFRFNVDEEGDWIVVYLKATPTQIGELARLNPHLSEIVEYECQH